LIKASRFEDRTIEARGDMGRRSGLSDALDFDGSSLRFEYQRHYHGYASRLTICRCVVDDTLDIMGPIRFRPTELGTKVHANPSSPPSSALIRQGRLYPGFSLKIAIAVLCCSMRVASASAQVSNENSLSARPIPFELIQLVPATPVVTLSAEQVQELDQWTRDFAEWQKWADRWLNHRQSGRWAYAVDRHQKPDPPVWLGDVCDLLAGDGEFVRPCELLASWRENPVAERKRRARAATASQTEAVTKSAWWRHLHLDGLWSTTQSNNAAVGLFGAHVSVEIEGRLQVFAAPGILLVSLPSVYGHRDLSSATDWGVTYRLFDAGRSTVHFNFVHAWVLVNRAGLIDPNVTLAGFSVSFKPRPR
jgi:hypothetical protein